ncbi:putative Zn(II)2Cys6 transcription factor, partial [Aspergillus homomorphus CBS 101889]
MPSASRPVKLACLACRASKTRCDGQRPCVSCSTRGEECQYQPSQRGGARRGPMAAAELARRRAQRLANRARIENHSHSKDSEPHCQDYHSHSHPSAIVPFSPSSLSSIDLTYHLPAPSLESLSIGLPSPRVTEELLAAVELPAWSIRAYRCDQDLLNAYYIFIHPYFPFLPPPAVSQYEDKCVALDISSSYANASTLPYWPTSPLALAMAAILVLIPPPGRPRAAEDEAVMLRRSYADLYARSALELVDDSLENSSRVTLAGVSRNGLHPTVPPRIEPVLALGLLSLYEYSQRGSTSKMRARANQALTLAMDLSVHTENVQTRCLDAHRRCWWATVFLVYLSSILNASPPLITFDDLRITTIYPEFRGCREPWPLFMNAQVALFRSCSLGRQLVGANASNDSTGLPRSLGEDIKRLDSFILELAAEADRFRCVTNYQGSEADASRNLWAISKALIYTSRLTLHRLRAFLDSPAFPDERHDFLLAGDTIQTNPSSPSRTTRPFHLSPNLAEQITAVFPFTGQESVRFCLQSALAIARVFRRLPSPNPMYSDEADDSGSTGSKMSRRRLVGSPRSIPYMASCQLQSFYTLAMLLQRVRTALSLGNLGSYAYLLSQPSATTEMQDMERLVEELQCGMDALARSLQADAVFEGVALMAKAAEKAYEAT